MGEVQLEEFPEWWMGIKIKSSKKKKKKRGGGEREEREVKQTVGLKKTVLLFLDDLNKLGAIRLY